LTLREKVLAAVRENPSLSNRQVAELVGCGKTMAQNYRAEAGMVRDNSPREITQEAIEQSLERASKEGKLKRRLDEVQQENELLRRIIEQNKVYKALVEAADSRQKEPPTWLAGPKRASNRLATPTAMLSDLHLDEKVFPEQVGFVNEYNRQIAELRLRNFFLHTIELSKDYLKGLDFDGIVLAMPGDNFSGDIHEELRRTNEATIFESLLHWIDPMVAGIRLLADNFGRVFIPATPGNHGRLSHKPIAKLRAQDNLDWLFPKLLEREFAGDKRVTFDIADSADKHYKVHRTRMLLTHGDQFRGGGGIAGLLSPLMIGDHRKRKRQQAINQPYDFLAMGHWHQREYFKNVIVNGSLKGYDEYAFISNFDYQEPLQSYWLTDPDHGITISAPVFVRDKSETHRPENLKN
jgi:hypothetical protein